MKVNFCHRFEGIDLKVKPIHGIKLLTDKSFRRVCQHNELHFLMKPFIKGEVTPRWYEDVAQFRVYFSNPTPRNCGHHLDRE